MTIKTYCLIFALAALFAYPQQNGLAQSKSPTPVIIEESEPLPPPFRSLGTTDYKFTTKEHPFFERLSKEDRQTGGILKDYSLQNKAGKYVSWCGIVRAIKNDPSAITTTANVEMKFFDGAQDAHMMTVDWHGAGDFVVKMNTCVDIPLLSLIRVYGQVTGYQNNVPTLDAEYIRVWPWGLFNFMNLSGQKGGDDRWRKLSKVDENEIYEACPNFKYYSDRLGAPPKSQRFVGFSQPNQPDSITDVQIEKSPDPVMLYVKRAIDRLDHKYLDGTIADTKEAIRLDKRCAPAYGIRAMAEREKGLYSAALADVNYALLLNPNSDSSYSTRGQIYSCLGDHKAAIADYNKAIELKPSRHTRYAARAEEYEALGKYQEAINDYNHFLEIEPKAKSIANKRDKLIAKLKQR